MPTTSASPSRLPPDCRTLQAIAADPHYASRFTEAGIRIADAQEPADLVDRLAAGARALGAESAVFISFVREAADLSSCRLTAACDPRWCQLYLQQRGPTKDPWLAYAVNHSEPIRGSQLRPSEDGKAHVELAARHGFQSVVLAPAHSACGQTRISVLVLGSAVADFFEDEGYRLLRIGARMLAAELHDWWLARIRRQLAQGVRVRDDELELLRYEHKGWSSKRIADALDTSVSSINSRFQRLNVKLGRPNRHASARLAVELGLIDD